MSWMKTITRNASRPNPIRVPRPYETTPSMPDMLPSSPLDFRGKAVRSARQLIGENALRGENSGQNAEAHRFGIVGRGVLNLDPGGRAHADARAGQLERHPRNPTTAIAHDHAAAHVPDT